MRTPSIQSVIKPVLCSLGVVYLAYHAMHGERGLYALFRELHHREVLEQDYAQTKAAREAMELKVSHMRDDSLDLDLLDEQYRRMLGGMKAGEVIVLFRDQASGIGHQ